MSINRTHNYNRIIIIRHSSMVLHEILPFCQLLSSMVRHNRCIIIAFPLLGYYPLLHPNISYNLQQLTEICSPLGHLFCSYRQELHYPPPFTPINYTSSSIAQFICLLHLYLGFPQSLVQDEEITKMLPSSSLYSLG